MRYRQTVLHGRSKPLPYRVKIKFAVWPLRVKIKLAATADLKPPLTREVARRIVFDAETEGVT